MCLGVGDSAATVMCSYLTRQALDELGIGNGITVESSGLTNCSKKAPEEFTVKSLKRFNIDCSGYLSRCTRDIRSLDLFDVIFCTDLAALTHARQATDKSVKIIHIEGLGTLSVLSDKTQTDFDAVAQMIHTFVRKFLRDYADALADQN